MLLKFCNLGILELRYLASLLVESNGIFFAEHNVTFVYRLVYCIWLDLCDCRRCCPSAEPRTINYTIILACIVADKII